MELIDALDGFCTVAKRSPSLDGSVPLRAFRGCQPFIDGNSAGVHISLAAVGAVQGGDRPRLWLQQSVRERLGEVYAPGIERLVKAGLLIEGGYWHEQLSRGPSWPTSDGRLALWTGLLVRAARSTAVWLGTPFNRRCGITVSDEIIVDTEDHVPVVLHLDPGSVATWPVMLDTELACLTAVVPDVRWELGDIEDHAELGAALNRFYGEDPAQDDVPPGKTGRYRRQMNAAAQGWESGDCKLVTFGGPECRELGGFDSFLDARGRSPDHPVRFRLQYGIIRAMADIACEFDGTCVRIPRIPVDDGARAMLLEHWRRLYGDESASFAENIVEYAHSAVLPRQEPVFSVAPWMCVATPPGWSSVVDGLHQPPHLEGLRGVVGTDCYPFAPPGLRAARPGKFTIAAGSPLARVLPVPRPVLFGRALGRDPRDGPAA